MFQLDLKSRKSIYEQIIDNIKELIITGILQTEEKLPSVRELSRMLTVNPNTIQKAYRELERQGFVYTVSGLGCFVSPPDNRLVDQRQINEVRERLRGDIMELFYLGFNEEDIRSLLQEMFEERGECK
ncbi:GntR family transcriptional regulator [Bacilliculturomica massiliensis]|uniref:GntR family transcriptional regulator n=1 Tax=Bacilliculturomica massiliensis TaxID=1917867 RepID=UPI0010314507|nr:GntR family transcriptional regulator [Bacilliculturomica massiliensis]